MEIIDSYFAQAISDTAKMAVVLDAIKVVVGLKSGIMISLVDLDVELDDGLDKIEYLLKGKEVDESVEVNEEEIIEKEDNYDIGE